MEAEVPDVPIDVLIVESTYGVQVLNRRPHATVTDSVRVGHLFRSLASQPHIIWIVSQSFGQAVGRRGGRLGVWRACRSPRLMHVA